MFPCERRFIAISEASVAETLVLNSLITSAESAFHHELQNEQRLGFSINTKWTNEKWLLAWLQGEPGTEAHSTFYQASILLSITVSPWLTFSKCVPWGQIGGLDSYLLRSRM